MKCLTGWIWWPIAGKKQVELRGRNKHKNGCTVNIVDNGRAQPHMNKTWRNWREEKPVGLLFYNFVGLHVAILSYKNNNNIKNRVWFFWWGTSILFDGYTVLTLITKTALIKKKKKTHWETAKGAHDGPVVKATERLLKAWERSSSSSSSLAFQRIHTGNSTITLYTHTITHQTHYTGPTTFLHLTTEQILGDFMKASSRLCRYVKAWCREHELEKIFHDHTSCRPSGS